MAFMQYPTQNEGDKSQDQPNDEVLLDRLSVLERLPAEIIQSISSYLSASDLACFGVTSRTLAEHANNDLLWADLVNERLPVRIQDPGLFKSFRRLYLAYHPCWFIPQHKIWFGDTENTGTLILARYDNRRGVIDAYRVVAERGSPQFQMWDSNPEVMIQSFNPEVHLWLDESVLLLKDPDPTSQTAPIQRFESMSEIKHMPLALEAHQSHNAISFCSVNSEEQAVDSNMLWPPQTIPSKTRAVRDSRHSPSPVPQNMADLSEMCFRIKKLMPSRLMFSPASNERVVTYSTLDPIHYTPTKDKPYQGIWVGDYSAHGCEFLLVLQKDPAPSDTGEDDLTTKNDENDIEAYSHEEVGQQGRLEAIKLTGDPNVPRGQFSFVAEDIGSRGLIKIATDEPFIGARVVRCCGHLAGLGFRDETFIDSELILISPDCMAHYWAELGHISYFRRVDIDALLRI